MAHGLDVRDAPFPATPTELGSFDVVTAIEVIEHVRIRARRSTGSGRCPTRGMSLHDHSELRLSVAAPHRTTVAHHDYPEHINLFTPRTLDRLLSSAGLTQFSMRTTGISPSEIWRGLRPASEGTPPGRPSDLR